MNWNSIYHVYEVIALSLIGLCWWTKTTSTSTNNTPHWQAFDYTLKSGVMKSREISSKMMAELKSDVKKQGNSREGLERIKRAEVLQQRTNKLMRKLNAIKSVLRNAPPNARKATSDWMIRQGKAYELKRNLDTYVTWLSKEYEDLDLPKFYPLAEGRLSHVFYPFQEKNQDFAHYFFEYTSPAEALAIMTEKQVTIKRYQHEVQKKLGASSFSTCKFDRVEAGTFAPVQTVQVGDVYQADLFIQSSASKANPRMVAGNTPVPVDGGEGKVAFLVKGVGKKYWIGGVTFKSQGKDTTINFRGDFEVVDKPK